MKDKPKTPEQLAAIQEEARESLRQSAIKLRAMVGGPLERILNWQLQSWPFSSGYPDVWIAKVGRGQLILWTWDIEQGIRYTSSFGPDSDRSFSGYLPGLSLEEAKLLVYHDAIGHW
jgi:hypothetical protein